MHPQALVVMGLFAGFALTVVVVILQSPSAFRVAAGPLTGEAYFETVATWLAAVGSISVFGVLATLELASGLAAPGSGSDRLGYACFLVALFGWMVVLPLLLLPFTRVGAGVEVALEIGLLYAYFSASGSAPAPTAGNAGRRAEAPLPGSRITRRSFPRARPVPPSARTPSPSAFP
jgi:hypothetical protein